MTSNLLGVCDHDFLDVRRDHRPNRGRVACRFDDDHVLLGELLGENFEKKAAHVDAPSRFSLPSSQATASAKVRWICNPMIRMLLLRFSSFETGAGGPYDIYLSALAAHPGKSQGAAI